MHLRCTTSLYCLLLSASCLLLFSCEGDVRFTTQQPNSVPALKEVPASLQGDYVSNNDSLYVRANSMTLIRPTRITIPIADTSKIGLSKGKNGKYYFKAGEDRYVEKMNNDSATIVTRNTQVYKLGKDTVLKIFNGDYWLSMKNITADNKEEWKVMQITLHKNKLSIAVPSLPKDEKRKMSDRMDEKKSTVDSTGVFSCVTPFTRSSDQTYYVVAATPDQLKNLDRRGLFRPVATFDKVK
ncbi:MAG: hypothetical protein HY064_14245 [Bacteroidetes bacterium]|nr:hypothetical protein [Bacteroidota bacterium]